MLHNSKLMSHKMVTTVLMSHKIDYNTETYVMCFLEFLVRKHQAGSFELIL